MFFFAACSKNKVPEDLLVKVYVESVVINETYVLQSDSVRIHKQKLFDKYKISENDFEREMGKLSYDKEAWERFFKKANDYLNDLKASKAIN